MPIVASDSGTNDFVPAPAGNHNAVCVDVVDIGITVSSPQYGSKEKRTIVICWEIDEEMDDGVRFCVSQWFTLSLAEKANLRHVLESWRGRQFTPEELKGFDVEKVIGVPALVTVVHKTGSKGGTFANVTAVTPLPKGMPKLVKRDYTRSKKNTELAEAWIRQQAAEAANSQAFRDEEEEFHATDDMVPF